MGGWTLRSGGLIKSSYMALNELQVCQPIKTKDQQKNKNKTPCFFDKMFKPHWWQQIQYLTVKYLIFLRFWFHLFINTLKSFKPFVIFNYFVILLLMHKLPCDEQLAFNLVWPETVIFLFVLLFICYVCSFVHLLCLFFWSSVLLFFATVKPVSR